MIHIKGSLSPIEEKNIINAILSIEDKNSDFYLTKNNSRLFKQNLINPLLKQLRKGDLIIFDDSYKSLAVIIGKAEKSSRLYLKILSTKVQDVVNLLSILFWNFNEDLYIKLKKNNELIYTLTYLFGFVYIGSRDREVLLRRNKDDRNRSSRPFENRD